jgi:hypothetical protein
MREVAPSGSLLVEVRVADEPVLHVDTLWPALRQLMSGLGDEPKTVWTTSPGGRAGRERKFSWETMTALAQDENVGTISSAELRRLPVGFSLSLYLRHNPKLPVDAQPPAKLSMAVELQPGVLEAAKPARAAVEFLAACATHMPVLHGGVTVLDNIEQAHCELTGGLASDAAKQSPQFQQRREHDWWRNQTLLRSHCRRLYWTTLLGPELTQASGGAAAARAAGAVNIREINGCILFQAIDGPPADSLDPSFLGATTALRRWLWPHTFQNPLDASGFEPAHSS